ncbi:MAG TPA: 4-hydroxythreonine-4-phosphate dehydrogenase PdxA [Saprospiraceae bacterium]|nr:4-hydroxythreonine-4-phosphate dehydrogenase PdxA [Saprospiraceae bacterium]HMQ84522.1 4-hydroxythreonine-4-phosphate dehydrogenase PdxA [Saprospiraceae bacterium]
MEKLKIGISIGDINGIGLEIILKTLSQSALLQHCTPIIYGSSKVVSYHKNIVGEDCEFHSLREGEKFHFDKVNVVNCWQENVNITLGKASEIGGQYAWRSLDAAVKSLKRKEIDALVTAPINKEAMNMAGFPFPGHTEYLTKELGSHSSLMFLVNDEIRIGLATNHLPVSEIASHLTKEGIIQKVQMMHESLKMDFGLERPTIAVLGLNPHAGDGGTIGLEEEQIIRPAIVECKKKGMMVMGPFPADGFFGSGQYKKFDAILAMYHDQGLIPFKLLAFGSGVNYTAGLSHVRTSPDHGTAFDLAGKNAADPSSFRQALFLAIDIAQSRNDYADMHKNALVKRDKPKEVEEEDEMVYEED